MNALKNSMLIDSHCHLHFSGLVERLSSIVEKMLCQGVGRALTVATQKNEWTLVHRLTAKYPQLYGAIGIHPDQPKEVLCTPEELIEATQEAQIIAVGETGLDYHYHQDSKAHQKARFEVHIEAAKKANLPLIIHMRDATKDTLAILKAIKPTRGVFHCFTEDCDIARQALDLGFYISLSGIVTFKNAKLLHQVARFIPIERLLIETDAPYLAPTPYRGQQNEPAYVREIATWIGHLRQAPFESLVEQTQQNFFDLFTKASKLS